MSHPTLVAERRRDTRAERRRTLRALRLRMLRAGLRRVRRLPALQEAGEHVEE